MTVPSIEAARAIIFAAIQSHHDSKGALRVGGGK